MTKKIRQGFADELIELAIDELVYTKPTCKWAKHGKKYGQILSSIREAGLIEAPVVAPFKKEKGYLLLDGHLRVTALKELGHERVICLISTDDEAYTYNKFVNRLSAIQEHRMIIKAIQDGVSEEKIASALNLERGTIRNKKFLLDGICQEVVELLKDKHVSERVFRALKKMKAPRQIAVAMLMNDQNRFTKTYIQALLDATPQEQLVNNGKPKKETPLILARQVRLEEESLALNQDIAAIKGNYGTEMVEITSVQAYLKRLLGNAKVAAYLQKFHEPIYEKFSEIAGLDFFKLKSAG